MDDLDLDATATLRAFADRFATRFDYRPGAAEVPAYDVGCLFIRAVRDDVRSGEELRVWLDALGRERAALAGVSGALSFTTDGDVQRPLVLCDVKMPAASGLVLYEWIEQHRPALVPRFAFVAGDVDAPELQRFASAHPTALIAKPFAVGEYLDQVPRVLDQPAATWR